MGSERHLLVIAGVRPQYVKAAALRTVLAEHAPDIGARTLVLDTGQHYSPSLAADLQSSIGLTPDHVLRHNEGATELTIMGSSLAGIDLFVRASFSRPPVVVVFGDANPALIGAVAGHKLYSPVVHVEAGARRDEREPEHWNSKIADFLADLRCCVTERAVRCLAQEGIDKGTILTGDIAAPWFRALANSILGNGESTQKSDAALVTLHRPANMDTRTMLTVFDAVRRSGLACRFVAHPRSKAPLANARVEDVVILEPLSVPDLIREVHGAKIVVTDSGGLAREAHYLRRPVVMRRDAGGWPELREADVLCQAGRDLDSLMEAIKWALWRGIDYPTVRPLERIDGLRLAVARIRALCDGSEGTAHD